MATVASSIQVPQPNGQWVAIATIQDTTSLIHTIVTSAA